MQTQVGPWVCLNQDLVLCDLVIVFQGKADGKRASCRLEYARLSAGTSTQLFSEPLSL